MSVDSAGPLGRHKGLHHDANIRALLNRLTAMESEGYAVTTHAYGKVEISYPTGGSVYLVYSQPLGEWIAVEHNEWGTE